MNLATNESGRTEAMRLAQSTELFGFQSRLIAKLEQADYRNALLLCRRAMAGEEEHFATHFMPEPRAEHLQPRRELLRLLKLINTLRLEMRTSASV
jgi:hypothetical protein